MVRGGLYGVARDEQGFVLYINQLTGVEWSLNAMIS